MATDHHPMQGPRGSGSLSAGSYSPPHVSLSSFAKKNNEEGSSSCQHSTSTSPSLSPKGSPLHTSNDTLNSSASVCSGTGSLQNSSGISISSFSTTSSSSTGSNLSLADYLSQLIKDKKQMASFPKMFYHVERLLDEEISKVRINLFQVSGGKNPLVLPDEQGAQVTLTEKVYVPIKDYPDFNFVGRILGPRGLTAKELEKQTGCKIMIRGKGSMRDKNKESQNKGKPNWDHLNDELHVLITVEDTVERARLKLDRAVGEITKMLVPLTEAEDELKKRQLMELAILNGTYRDSPKPQNVAGPVATSQYYINPQAFIPAVALAGQLRQQALAGNSLILNSGRHNGQLQMNNGGQQHFFGPVSPSFNHLSASDAAQAAAAAGFLFSPYDYAAYNPSLAAILSSEYGMDLSGSVGGFLHR